MVIILSCEEKSRIYGICGFIWDLWIPICPVDFIILYLFREYHDVVRRAEYRDRPLGVEVKLHHALPGYLTLPDLFIHPSRIQIIMA